MSFPELGHPERALHVREIAAREGRRAPWPTWADAELVAAWRAGGVDAPWAHQLTAGAAARSGKHVVLATGTASGKSLAYQLPVLTALREGERAPDGRGATALYISPTKALAADQVAALERLGEAAPRVAAYDGDTPAEARAWARDHASLVLTNPDMLHAGLLPAHPRWAPFWRSLRFVVVDECHHYRGVFGAGVAQVLRRLRRVAAHHRADPVFLLASATTAEPADTAARLTGLEPGGFVVVDDDASPRGRLRVALWEPPLLDERQDPSDAAPIRRSATAETAHLLADLVTGGHSALAFVGSRRAAEVVSSYAGRLVGEVDPALTDRVAGYRGGYLPEDRRRLETALRSGELLGLATTNALELGIDVAGLDAVVICGWPGRRASFWQQTGRAGRRGGEALAVLVARDDPLDAYLVRHPEAIFEAPVEATVLDAENPYVLAPHLCAAAAELPLRPEELGLFGAGAREIVDALVERGALRARRTGWFWTRPERATDLVDLRGTGGDAFQVVDAATGRVLGTVDAAAVDHTVHPGAVHLHQGRSWLVAHLDVADRSALVEPTGPEVTTQARDVVDIRIVSAARTRRWGPCTLTLGQVDVTSQVVSFTRREVLTGRVLDEHPLDFPPRTLRTAAVWWTMPDDVIAAAGVDARDVPGAAHAAEHASIGILPLVATCDRWDVGGVSTALHPDTGELTVFVHDGHPGGAGFAARGFHAATTWLGATRTAIEQCPCATGCPSCIQSPKCGNGNHPLHKAGAVRLLTALLEVAPCSTPDPRVGPGPPPR